MRPASSPAPERLPRDRVPWRTFFTGVHYRIWLEGEMLLYHEVSSYSERCKRFALRDIHALVISRTRLQSTLTATLLVVAAVAILPAAIVYDVASPMAGILSLGGMWTVLGSLLLLNLLAGPTCSLDLHTAVQVQRLHSCHRMRTARRAVERLKPEIRNRQEDR